MSSRSSERQKRRGGRPPKQKPPDGIAIDIDIPIPFPPLFPSYLLPSKGIYHSLGPFSFTPTLLFRFAISTGFSRTLDDALMRPPLEAGTHLHSPSP